MLTFHFHPTPNPAKVAQFLEESGLPCELVAVDMRKDEQHAPTPFALSVGAQRPSRSACSIPQCFDFACLSKLRSVRTVSAAQAWPQRPPAFYRAARDALSRRALSRTSMSNSSVRLTLSATASSKCRPSRVGRRPASSRTSASGKRICQ